jgi:segregation and condensation protein B
MRHPLLPRPPSERPVLHRPPSFRPALAWRLVVEDDEPRGEQARDRPLALVEAALLLADEPLTVRRLAGLSGLTDAAETKRLIERLQQLYDAGGSAFQVEELAGGYQLLTRPEFHPWLARLRRNAPETQLSTAARETLAIVAYRQPVTRADIEVIRGVGTTDVLKQLMEKGLVRHAGHDDSLGRPALYETTKKFLQLFGLGSLRDLPPAEGLSPAREKEKREGEGGIKEEKEGGA